MGSQLAKGDHQPSPRISSSGISSLRHPRAQQQSSQKRSSPLASEVSSSSSTSGVPSSPHSQEKHNNSKSRIVVVNAGPSATQNNSSGVIESRLKRLPALLRPLIPIGQTVVNPNYPQLQSQPVIDLGLELEQEFRANAELVAREQTKLIDKIRDIDQQVAASSATIGAERQRRFNKAVDNFGKFDEIEQLINRCESDIENILTVFVQLNEALPDTVRLEPFAVKA